MNPIKLGRPAGAGKPPETAPARNGFVWGSILVVLLAVILPFALKNSSQRPAAPITVAAKVATPATSSIKNFPLASAAPAPKSATPVVAAPAPISPGLLTTSQLVDELAKIGNGPVTPEQAARFKADLQELVHRGAASVPAIQQFLQQNTDIAYGDVPGDQLGYSGLRATLIDALNQIGGPAAQSAMLTAMNTTASPSELLQLAQDLDRQAPGQYHDQIVASAQQTLALASSGQLGTNAELGPAFRTLQNYGSANNDPVAFNDAVQLANLPNGQGLSALMQIQQSSSGSSQLIATEMIAQMAGQNGNAQTAFSQMVQNNQIPPEDWVQLAPILAGSQYQMDSSGQNSTLVNQPMTPDQAAQQIALINQILNSLPPGTGTGPAKSLQQTVAALSGKLGN